MLLSIGVPILSPALAVAQVAPPTARQELAPIRNVGAQDTTKSAQEKKRAVAPSEIQQFSPHVSSMTDKTSTPGSLGLIDFRDRLTTEFTIEVIDSLGRLYPELKDYMLKLAAIKGVLKIDSLERDRRKLLDRAFADLRLPSELESKLRRNQAWFGTRENPMKPPPPPNQINLFDVIKAVSNLLQYLGVR